MKKTTAKPIAVTAVRFTKSFDTIPRRIEFDGISYDLLSSYKKLTVIGEEGEEVFVAQELAPEGVHQTHGPVLHGLEERGDHFEALFFRAEIYRQLRDFPRARTDLEALLSVEPASPLICGLYPGDIAGRTALLKRKDEAKAILKTM